MSNEHAVTEGTKNEHADNEYVGQGQEGHDNAVHEHDGKKYFINIEGQEYPWDRETITVQEIRQLGNIPADQSIVHESPDGTERTLVEGETVELKPGHRHGRTAKYKRG